MEAAVLDISSSDDEREAVRSPSFKRSLASVPNDDDDEEVVVIDKPYWFENHNRHSKRTKNRRQIEESEQNDCWVLDGDPDKVDPDPGSCADDKEDLVVTAEKGPKGIFCWSLAVGSVNVLLQQQCSVHGRSSFTSVLVHSSDGYEAHK